MARRVTKRKKSKAKPAKLAKPAAKTAKPPLEMRLINCDCGYQVMGSTDDELWEDSKQHFAAYHPDWVGKVSRVDFLELAEEI